MASASDSAATDIGAELQSPSPVRGAADRPTHRLFLDRILTLGAIALLWYAAFWPIFQDRPVYGIQPLAVLAIITAGFGGILLPRGGRIALALLWAAFGMAAAIGTLGIFSIGVICLIAAALLLG